MAELALTLPVDGGHPDLIGGVGLQSREHHRGCRGTEVKDTRTHTGAAPGPLEHKQQRLAGRLQEEQQEAVSLISI